VYCHGSVNVTAISDRLFLAVQESAYHLMMDIQIARYWSTNEETLLKGPLFHQDISGVTRMEYSSCIPSDRLSHLFSELKCQFQDLFGVTPNRVLEKGHFLLFGTIATFLDGGSVDTSTDDSQKELFYPTRLPLDQHTRGHWIILTVKAHAVTLFTYNIAISLVHRLQHAVLYRICEESFSQKVISRTKFKVFRSLWSTTDASCLPQDFVSQSIRGLFGVYLHHINPQKTKQIKLGRTKSVTEEVDYSLLSERGESLAAMILHAQCSHVHSIPFPLLDERWALNDSYSQWRLPLFSDFLSVCTKRLSLFQFEPGVHMKGPELSSWFYRKFEYVHLFLYLWIDQGSLYLSLFKLPIEEIDYEEAVSALGPTFNAGFGLEACKSLIVIHS
jgi:hypothetical protein